MSTAPTPTTPSSNTLFTHLETHPYTTDPSYQSGLSAILSQTPPPYPQTLPATPENRDLHLRARCFYFARQHPELVGPSGVDFAAYAAWRARQPEEELNPLVLTCPPLVPGGGGSVEGSVENTPERPQRSRRVDGVEGSADKTPSRPQRSRLDAADASAMNTPDRRPSAQHATHTTNPTTNGTTPHTQNHTPPHTTAPHLPNASTSHGASNGPTASFQEVMELIKEGKPIPGIREIPDTVLEGQGTRATAAVRRKPWERAAGEEGAPTWQTGGELREMFPRSGEAT